MEQKPAGISASLITRIKQELVGTQRGESVTSKKRRLLHEEEDSDVVIVKTEGNCKAVINSIVLNPNNNVSRSVGETIFTVLAVVENEMEKLEIEECSSLEIRVKHSYFSEQ